MANSTYYGNYNGSQPSGSPPAHRLVLNISTIETIQAENRTVERCRLYMQVNNSSYQYYNLYNHNSGLNIGGAPFTNNATRFDARSTGNKNLIAQWDISVNHETDGSKTINVSGWHNSGVLLGNGSVSGVYECDTIPRYANITTHNVSNLTVNSFRVNWATNVNVDQVQRSLNGGAWTTVSGSGTSGNYTISGLNYNTSYTIRTRVRRTDSQLYTQSGLLTLTTRDIARITSLPSEAYIGDTVNIKSTNPGECLRHIIITYNDVEIISRKVDVTNDYDIVFTDAERTVLYAVLGSNYSGVFKVSLKSYVNTVYVGEHTANITIKRSYNIWVKPTTTWLRGMLWFKHINTWKMSVPFVKVGSNWIRG